MQLSQYLADQRLSPREFAAKIGVSSEAVRLYLKGARRPRLEILHAIRKETAGAVTPNDFFAMDGAD